MIEKKQQQQRAREQEIVKKKQDERKATYTIEQYTVEIRNKKKRKFDIQYTAVAGKLSNITIFNVFQTTDVKWFYDARVCYTHMQCISKKTLSENSI